MGRFYGKVGFAVNGETSPGVWVENIIEEKSYYMEVTSDTNRFNNRPEVVDNFTISNTVSFLSDHYSTAHISNIKYVEFMGTKWKVERADIKFPRLILAIGGVYNG